MQLPSCREATYRRVQAKWDLSTRKKLVGPGPPDARLTILPTKVIDGILNYVYADPA